MDGLPKIGQTVAFDDSWFYPGRGIVVETQTQPHLAVKVKITEIALAGQHFLGRESWILPARMEVVEEAWTCSGCGHEAHMAGWCTFDSHPACDCNEESSEIPEPPC